MIIFVTKSGGICKEYSTSEESAKVRYQDDSAPNSASVDEEMKCPAWVGISWVVVHLELVGGGCLILFALKTEFVR